MFSAHPPQTNGTRAPKSLRAAFVLLLATVLATAGIAASESAVPGPIHAGNTYGWYHHNNVWRQEFVGGLPSFWHRHGRGTVRTQHGMITLETSHGTLSATLTGHAHRYGRWEVRLRSRRYEEKYTNYKVATELIPARAAGYHCGAQNIGLENYRLGTRRAHLYTRTLPNLEFAAKHRMHLRNDQWHTFAVEVTKSHISWFIDAHVVRTERRDAALSGKLMTFRFSLIGTPGKRMNHSRLQADWMRYWTYNRPSTKSIKAPQLVRGTYDKAC
ncbi:LamG domain-containing protein [Nocardioides montaniterrae]